VTHVHIVITQVGVFGSGTSFIVDTVPHSAMSSSLRSVNTIPPRRTTPRVQNGVFRIGSCLTAWNIWWLVAIAHVSEQFTLLGSQRHVPRQHCPLPLILISAVIYSFHLFFHSLFFILVFRFAFFGCSGQGWQHEHASMLFVRFLSFGGFVDGFFLSLSLSVCLSYSLEEISFCCCCCCCLSSSPIGPVFTTAPKGAEELNFSSLSLSLSFSLCSLTLEGSRLFYLCSPAVRPYLHCLADSKWCSKFFLFTILHCRYKSGGILWFLSQVLKVTYLSACLCSFECMRRWVS